MKTLLFILLGLSLTAPSYAEEQTSSPNTLQYEEVYDINLNDDLQAQLLRYFYNFGPTLLSTTKSVRFTLRNFGTLPLYINSIRTQGNGFWHQENCPGLLWPGQRCSIRAFFRPLFLGLYSGRVNIDLLGGEDIWVDLRGRGAWAP